MKNFLFLLICALALNAKAESNSASLDALGNQEPILNKAEPRVPRNTYRVVQKRIVDRHWRTEFSIQSSLLSGGDSYYSTNGLGAHFELHINPRWSLGLRHQWFFNELTNEGKRIFDRSEAEQALSPGNPNNTRIPSLDYPVSQTIATVSYYPLYGKMSLFDSTVSYFDLYVLLGGGQIALSSGGTGVWTSGVGFGAWWTQHFSTRAEVRYQQYTDQALAGGREIGNTMALVGVGFLL